MGDQAGCSGPPGTRFQGWAGRLLPPLGSGLPCVRWGPAEGCSTQLPSARAGGGPWRPPRPQKLAPRDSRVYPRHTASWFSLLQSKSPALAKLTDLDEVEVRGPVFWPLPRPPHPCGEFYTVSLHKVTGDPTDPSQQLGKTLFSLTWLQTTPQSTYFLPGSVPLTHAPRSLPRPGR